MKQGIKRIISLVLVCTMTFSVTATPTFAWSLEKWVKTAADDVVKTAEDAVDTVEDAARDAKKWTDRALEDSERWLKGAIDDVDGFLTDIGKGIKNYRRAEKPKINGMYDDISNVVASEDLNKDYVNVFNESIGSFSEMVNVKERQLPQATQDRIKQTLKNAGLSDYWSQFAVNKVSGASEGVSVGQIVESVIPFDFILNGMVADEIDEIVAREGFEDIDLASKIQAASNVNGLEFKYTVDQLSEVSGPSAVMFTGVTSVGYRDQLTAKFIAGGVEYDAKPFVVNNQVGFYAKVAEVSNLTFVLVNDFDAPVNVPLEIAEGIQKTVNDLSPLGDPISNQAKRDIAEWLGDTETVYEQTQKDKKTGDKTKELKKMPSMNEFYASGDAGVIVSNLIYNIPVIGDIVSLIFKSTGNDATFANIVRDVVNQKEVKSFLKIENPQLLIERDLFDYTDEALTDFVANVNGSEYTHLVYYGRTAQRTINSQDSILKLPLEDDRAGHYKGQVALVSDANGTPLRAAAESTFEVTFNAKGYNNAGKDIDYGNANLIFGVQSVGLGNDQYNGQDIGFSLNNETLFYGTANYNWTNKASRSAFTLGQNHVLKVSVVREGTNYRAYLWFDGVAHGSFKLENYSSGMFGVRTWETDMSVSSIKVTTNSPSEVVNNSGQTTNTTNTSPMPTSEAEQGTHTEIMFEEFDNGVSFNKHDGSFSYNRAYGDSIYSEPTTSPNALMTFSDKTLANGIIETNLALYDPISGHGNAGVVFRISDAGAGLDNYQGYYVGIKPAASGYEGQVVIGKSNNGQWTSLKAVNGNYSSRNLYNLKVEMDGNRFKVYVDGVEKISITDNSYSSGEFGFRSYQIPVIYTNVSASSKN